MAQDAELAGHVLGGNFRLVRGVSDGPRKVYEARHDRLSGRFAVKTWPTTTPWDAFKRGAELASTLRHPGVMQVLDFNYEAGGPPFLVLEWVDGRRLSDLISESGLLPVERVAPLIESAAWALASAHQQGIVHQELRPEDIYVVQAPGSMREWVKIAGFGVNASLARVRKPPPSRYRAPEQESADATAALAGAAVEDGDDPQSDQYALAAIAYEMLAGVPPFDVDDARSTAAPLPIADLAPGVNPAIDAAIRQALAAEPEQRFAGVLEFARALRAGVEGAAPEAVRRMGDARTSAGKRDAVSPFFNPLQGAAEALRRVATSTAKLKTLAGEGGFWPARTSARIGFAGVLLFAAFAGTAFLTRNKPPPRENDPVAAVAPAEPPPSAPPEAQAEPTPDAEQTAVAEAEPQEADAAAEPEGQAVAAAPPAAEPQPIPTTTIVARSRPVARAAKVAPKAAAPATPPMCVMSVGSRPAADVLVDERSIGKRTPVAKYKLPCGDHKLVLRRADLDIYQMEIITLRPGVPFKKVYPLQ
jgi:serine/threonine-protein kinase